MEGSKARDDSIFTVRSDHSYVEYRIAQGYVPVVEHRRLSYIWSGSGGSYSILSVQTETIEVRPRLHPKLRKNKECAARWRNK
jgi:hypothetical protein